MFTILYIVLQFNMNYGYMLYEYIFVILNLDYTVL